MGMSHEINGNNCYLSQTSLQLSSLNSNCGETLILSQSSLDAMPRLVSGFEMNSLNAFNSLNQSVIINTNNLTNETPTQQILLVSSPMDLMAVPQPQQSFLAKAVPQSTGAVQMVLQTNEMPLISSGTQLNVIEVPTNLLLTDNNLIVIPQEGLTLEMPALTAVPSHQTIDNQLSYDNKSQTIVYNGSPQMLSAGQPMSFNPNVEQLVVNLNDCIAINAINNKSIDSTLNANQYFPTNHQIIGIIDNNTNEAKLLTTDQNAFNDDLNAFLANTMASNPEPELDPNEAKSWLNDSLIAYRAMVAFKKVMPNETPSPTSGIRVHK